MTETTEHVHTEDGMCPIPDRDYCSKCDTCTLYVNERCTECGRIWGYEWEPSMAPGAELDEQLGYYLADVPDATPAQIREAVSEFLDRDPREGYPL